MYTDFSPAAFAPPFATNLPSSSTLPLNLGASERPSDHSKWLRIQLIYTAQFEDLAPDSPSFHGSTSVKCLDKSASKRDDWQEYVNRLRFLQIYAQSEDEPFSQSSLEDLDKFICDIRPVKRPFLFLHENGNLRAVWRNEKSEQIGLEFLGNGAVQFVIFASRAGRSDMARINGVDVVNKISAQIRVLNVEHLLA